MGKLYLWINVQKLVVKEFQIYKGALDHAAQIALRDGLRDLVKQAPLKAPITPGGRPMSVRTTAAGRVGWVTGKGGYGYATRQADGSPWPDIPVPLTELWSRFSGVDRPADTCLINYYGEGARMGLHQDKDEGSFDWPVLSVSLGDDALFRMGEPTRGGATSSVWLSSGDLVLMAGAARRAFHGIDRLKFGSSQLLSGGGRLNLTLRVVEPSVATVP